MYDPPSKTNWVYTCLFDEEFAEAYNLGYEASKQNKILDDNPYRPSGHERDTTWSDELNYWWYSGW